MKKTRRGANKSDSLYLISEYKDLYVGFSSDKFHRQKGSSGGVGTEISSYLLEKKEIETVIGVGFSQRFPYRPEYQAVNEAREVNKISGSKYIYMKLSPLIRLIESNKEKKTAVFVQPCFVNAVRKMQKIKYKNIKYIISFFCGYNVTEEATAYLIGKAKANHLDIAEISYRWGEYPGGFMVKTKQGKIINFGKECYEIVDLMFLRNGCKKCSLYMGEGADIVLGDAWIRTLKNASVMIARNKVGLDLIKKMKRENQIKLFKIKEQELIQMHWHNLKYKKYGMGFFLNLGHQVLKTKIAKRMAPFRFLMFLSKIRRKFVIGIDIELQRL